MAKVAIAALLPIIDTKLQKNTNPPKLLLATFAKLMLAAAVFFIGFEMICSGTVTGSVLSFEGFWGGWC